MQKLVGLGLIVAVIIGLAPYARSLGTPSAPPGVTSSDWIPLGDAAGFVITGDTSSANAAKREPATVKGYFMIRRAAAWLRVDAQPDYNVQKAALTR